MRVRRLIACVGVLVLVIATVCVTPATGGQGATAGPPPYQLNRADEDYTYLRDPSRRADVWDPLKYMPLNGSGSAYLSLGGETRERYEYFNHPNWGQDPQGPAYFLHRLFVHGDLHLGRNVRFFGQLQNSLEYGRRGGPRPTDKDQLDVHQAFLDMKLDLSANTVFTLRSGRQELAYGSQRLISVREGPNVRQSFDGFRAMVRIDKVKVDGFVTKPVETNRYMFDDGPNNSQGLWGLYSVLPFPLLPKANVDIYYIGLYRREATFNQGTASERRHSAGIRLWRTEAPFDYNFEAVYQWGTFGNGAIRAWTIASDTGYTIVPLPFQPRIGLRADIASGDKNPANPDLQTFNPLFPKGAYFSEAGLIGPANFIDLDPSLALHLTKRLTLTFDWDFFWRQSTRDGIYNNAVSLVRSGDTNNARYIGSMPQVQFFWDMNRHISFIAIYGHFFAGPFLKETRPGKDVDYVTAWVTYKF